MARSKKISILIGALLFVTPFCTPDLAAREGGDFVLLIRMMGIQDAWFRENIIPSFEKEHDAKVTVASFDKFWDLEFMLKLEEEGKRHSIGLVKTPLEMTRPLRKYMLPYDDVMNEEDLKALKAPYDPAALERGIIDGKLYYLPRKLETRMVVYVKPRVEEAVRGWKRFEGEINAAMKQDNGCGLPAGYVLESDPDQWDYYDLFVVASYWAKTPYFGIKMPRMAHRGKKYGGTVVGLVDRVFQMGGTAEDVLRMSADPVVDMFVWEAIYRKNGLYNPAMWQDPWSGGGIWNAMKDGKVFLAMMHQIDCFFIHGGTHPQMQGYLANPDDMGIAVMPRGHTFELDDKGVPLRTGSRKAGTAGWWWAIPKTSPHPELSAALAQWITNYDNHLSECRVFGMMPIRKDITSDLQRVFPEEWMAAVFDTSVKQIELNGDTTVPLLPEYSDVGKIYLAAWYDIVVGENYGLGGRVDRNHIKATLEKRYVPGIKAILGDRYPE